MGGDSSCSALAASASLIPGESTSKANAFNRISLESRLRGQGSRTQFSDLRCQRREEKLNIFTWCSRAAGFSRVPFASRRPRRPWEAILAPPAIRPRLSFAPCTTVYDGSGENSMTPASTSSMGIRGRPGAPHLDYTAFSHVVFPDTRNRDCTTPAWWCGHEALRGHLLK